MADERGAARRRGSGSVGVRRWQMSEVRRGSGSVGVRRWQMSEVRGDEWLRGQCGRKEKWRGGWTGAKEEIRMLTMLVVDDEIYALKGITQGIEWNDLPIGTILEAENVPEAQKLLEEGKVDLVISDIEMPGANGIELLRYIRERSPGTLTIFLTGHARFEYAQEALHYGCFDYVLKPVDHDVLKEIVRRAVQELERRQEQQAFEETLGKYRRQWTNQLPVLVEKFWQEALAGRLPMSAERLNREFAMYDMPLSAEGRVLPVLLSVEQWDVEMDARDESIMEYALRKAAEEIIVGEQGAGAVLQDRNEQSVVLLYVDGGGVSGTSEVASEYYVRGTSESLGADKGRGASEAAGEGVETGLSPRGRTNGAGGPFSDRSALLARCRAYVQACNDYFHCRVSCYVGDALPIVQLADGLEGLAQLERANVSSTQTVIDANEAPDVISGSAGSGGQLLPPFVEWGILLDSASTDELLQAVEATLLRFQREGASRENLELFYHGFVHMLYQTAFRQGVPVGDMLTPQELGEGQGIRSPQLMQAWASKLVHKSALALQDRQRDASAVIGKIQAFIQDNLHKDLSRDDIAHSVYRNPAYLSRLFRKETGLSLTDYIAQAKIERAKRLLTDTNDKISNIAEGLGYLHFSYFAKLFKKVTGLTPQEYRKKHQAV
ncbi:response regulator transcription factor [Cohnella nanjingensis]|uniref:Response regulator n=1 Tax=Cohnella nanjingensis TaxID=1387779 RepID=A0A7X0RMR2_9BACL|nr:response regulator [Cohnella nanjingensis]MBB6670138.1 response regulator [Cohnella nanjingensis]